MSGRVFTVSKEAQRPRAEPVRIIGPDGSEQTMAARDFRTRPEPPPAPESEPVPSPDAQTLEALVESELKKQLRSLEGRELGLAIMNAIKFLAVRSRIPVSFGSELDEPSGHE
jgi:hypothetical protein